MKTMNRFIVAVIVAMIFISGAHAQVTATASSTGTIVTPISITKATDMNFGNIAVQASIAGTATLTPTGTRSSTGGVTLPVTTGTVTAASFTVNGQAAYTYAITLPSSAVTITSGANSMTINTFTSTPSGAGVLTGGTQTLTVGAKLNVTAAQAPGVYVSATPFIVIVNYN